MNYEIGKFNTVLKRRSEDLLDKLTSLEYDELLPWLVDTRPIHEELFDGVVPEYLRESVGVYRGKVNSVVEKRYASATYNRKDGKLSRKCFAPPFVVESKMSRLADYIEETLSITCSEDLVIRRMACTAHSFLNIHPYIDGNGHICRLLLSAIASHKNIDIKKDWTIHPRPYGKPFIMCLRVYLQHPDLLHYYMYKWFGRA